METHIEFYCGEKDFAYILEVPSVNQSNGIYRLLPKKEIQDATTYIIDCPSKRSGQRMISSIRAWLKQADGIELMDPERGALIGQGYFWAQLLSLPFDPEDYMENYDIEEIHPSK